MQKESSSKNIAAIVLARGGSKGIPHKNLMPFCGRPLLAWTLEQLKGVPEITAGIWVSSDDGSILEVAEQMGANPIRRPDELSGDESTSESGWLDALDCIEERIPIDLVVAAQVTSPIRDSSDFSQAINGFYENDYDSMFSASFAKDLCLWSVSKGCLPKCESYDLSNPVRRRQTTFGERWIENGSFYLFTPEVLLGAGTRFGIQIGIFPMAFWKMFEIDEPEDVGLCEVVMQAHLAGRL